MIGQGPRKFVGNVVSTKMQKSIVVEVQRLVKHRKYDVFLKRSKKFMAHDEAELAVEGDKVEIMSCRPLSKRKHFFLTKVLQPISGEEPFDAPPLPPLQRMVESGEKEATSSS